MSPSAKTELALWLFLADAGLQGSPVPNHKPQKSGNGTQSAMCLTFTTKRHCRSKTRPSSRAGSFIDGLELPGLGGVSAVSERLESA
jgi:hypothetical protein